MASLRRSHREGKHSTQRLMTGMNTPSKDVENGNEYFRDLCSALVKANIPLNKLQSEPIQQFLEKYTRRGTPDESTLRKLYVPSIFNDCTERMRAELMDGYLYIEVDETTDARGCYIANLIVGKLDPQCTKRPFLVACQQLEKTNSETISKFVNDGLKRLLRDYYFEDKILLLLTDAAKYMVKAAEILKIFYTKMVHVTCIVHGLNRIAEQVRELCPNVNTLVNNGKKVFLKAPNRVEMYRQEMEGPLPPSPVLTRWGTWLEAAVFYSDNYVQFKRVVEKLREADAVSIPKVKAAMCCPKVVRELAFIKTYASYLPAAMKKLEGRNLSLAEQFEVLEDARQKIASTPKTSGRVLREKFDFVFNKNEGLQFLQAVNAGNLPETMSPEELRAFQVAPLTSVEVERSFSMYKNILTDRRHRFIDENLEKMIILHFNSHIP